MVECSVCGEAEFVLTDGCYYCVQCNTQSQHAIEEELDQDLEGVQLMSTFGTAVRTTAQTQAQGKVVQEEGRYWQTFEAWTVILRKQVDSLAALGASPKLEETVLRLWMIYLQKLGIAFMKEKPVLVRAAQVVKNRDASVFSELPHMVQQRRPRVLDTRRASDKPGGDPDKEGGDPDKQGGDPDKLGGDPDDTEKRTEYKAFKEFRDIDPRWYNPTSMNKPKTLAFCYLGLLCCGNVVTWADLFRWIKDGRVPYYNVIDLLPADMRFAQYDCSVFTHESSHGILSVIRMHRVSGVLAKYLGLQNLPCLNIVPLCSQLILRLDLPSQMHGFIRVLWSRSSQKIQPIHNIVTALLPLHTIRAAKRTMTTEIELLAMALIIVVLKILFGLDGHEEKDLEQQARTCKASEKLPFNLTEWMRKTQRNQHVSAPKFMTGTSKDVRHIVDVNKYVANYASVFNSYSTSRNMRGIELHRASYQDQNRLDIVKPICELADHLAEIEEGRARQRKLSLEESEDELTRFLGPLNSTPQVATPVKSQPRPDEFKLTSVDYVFEGGAQSSQFDSEDFNDEDETAATSSQRLFPDDGDDDDVQTTTSARRDSGATEDSGDGISRNEDGEADSEADDKLPTSYRWLLSLCANIIGVNEEDLLRYVDVMELFLLRPPMSKHQVKLVKTFIYTFLTPKEILSEASDSE